MLIYRLTIDVSAKSFEQIVRQCTPEHLVLVGARSLGQISQDKIDEASRQIVEDETREHARVNGEDEDDIPRRLTQPRYANGKRDKGISAVDLVLKSLKESGKLHLTKTELTRIFVKRGFASTSVQPAISRLSQEQKVGCLANRVSLLKVRAVK